MLRYQLVIERCGDGSPTALAQAARMIARHLDLQAPKLLTLLAGGRCTLPVPLTPDRAGKLMAQLVTGETPCVDPTPFRYTRYFDGTNPRPVTGL